MSRGWYGVMSDALINAKTKKPIELMVEQVKEWLRGGVDVRVIDFDGFRKLTLERWCFKNIGRVLPVTSQIDGYMLELWGVNVVRVDGELGMRADERYYQPGETYPVPIQSHSGYPIVSAKDAAILEKEAPGQHKYIVNPPLVPAPDRSEDEK